MRLKICATGWCDNQLHSGLRLNNIAPDLEEGLLRDSAMFSVVAPEWPVVKSHLRQRLNQHANLSD
jgi:hypothetical protein